MGDQAFRGRYPARIDEKSRLKIPSEFRRLIEENHGRQVFVTSLNGRYARIYPMATWIALEQKHGGTGPVRGAAAKDFFHRSNYYGQTAEIDNQGRVLIPQVLRESADMAGEVDVIGHYDYLEVWNHARIAGDLGQPFDEDRLEDELSEQSKQSKASAE